MKSLRILDSGNISDSLKGSFLSSEIVVNYFRVWQINLHVDGIGFPEPFNDGKCDVGRCWYLSSWDMLQPPLDRPCSSMPTVLHADIGGEIPVTTMVAYPD